jgi:hypothetical protein
MGQEAGQEKMAEGTLMPRRVVGVTKKNTRTLVSIRTTDAVVGTTPEHPFAKVGAGWTPASQLAPGDRIVTRGAQDATLVAVKVREVPATPVYNLTVEKTHSYFVSDRALLVHNVGCGSGTKLSPKQEELLKLARLEKEKEKERKR